MASIEKSRKLFKDILFELFKEDENFDKMEFRFLKVFDIYIKKVKSFKNMSAVTQYFICETALFISLGEGSSVLREVGGIFRKKEPSWIEQKYSSEYGYNDPNKINIDRTPSVIKK